MNSLLLPKSLWLDEKIVLPRALVDALRDELVLRGLFDRACREKPDTRIEGGERAEDAIDHFTFMFKASAGRVQLVATDPNGKFESFPAKLTACFLDGRLSVLDIPCGSGGGLIGLLCAVAELRRTGQLPRNPLDVTVVAGDVSSDARAIHEAMLARVVGPLAEQGIIVRWDHTHWDVKNHFSTSELVDRWLNKERVRAEQYLLFVSAFSAFAHKNSPVVLDAVRDVVIRFHDRPLFVSWIEPDIEISRRFFPKLFDRLASLIGLAKEGTEISMADRALMAHPFRSEAITVRARVIKIDRLRS